MTGGAPCGGALVRHSAHHLRLARRLRGTQEGCAEEPGACTVLVGRRTPGGLVYEPATPASGCWRRRSLPLVTVEHLGRGCPRHPVQKATVDFHGSQCGFCTPGIVTSLYGLWMCKPDASEGEIETALQGNFSAALSYQPIIAAAAAASPAADHAGGAAAALRGWRRWTTGRGRHPRRRGPGDRAAELEYLAAVLGRHSGATIVAGSTDVGLWITKFMRNISPRSSSRTWKSCAASK